MTQRPVTLRQRFFSLAELNVAIKKSFFGGKITREPMRLDDWTLGSAELEDVSCVIAAGFSMPRLRSTNAMSATGGW